MKQYFGGGRNHVGLKSLEAALHDDFSAEGRLVVSLLGFGWVPKPGPKKEESTKPPLFTKV